MAGGWCGGRGGAGGGVCVAGGGGRGGAGGGVCACVAGGGVCVCGWWCVCVCGWWWRQGMGSCVQACACTSVYIART